MDPRLKDLSLDDQNIVAICYLDDLTRGNTYHGMWVRDLTFKGYMDTMASWVKSHTGRDIRIKPDPENLATNGNSTHSSNTFIRTRRAGKD